MKNLTHNIVIRGAPRLAELTGIRLGGKAIAEIVLRADAEAEKLPDLVAKLGGRPAVLGKGSNIIAADGDLPLVLIRQAKRDKLSFERCGGEILAKAEAGLPLSALLNAAASAGLSGLEALAGIPGSVGGAVAMNAGSFGTEIGTRVRSLTLFSPRLGLRKISAPEMEFSYRQGRCLGLPIGGAALSAGDDDPALLLEAAFALDKSHMGTVRERMHSYLAEKKLRQPVGAASAGCVFKNPAPDAPAGRLLEEAGMKGKSLGGMRFSPLHANFLVNEGGGSCAAALELMALAVEEVKRKSGFKLEKEVCLWL
ncbi:MAG: UDP-N-acetylmuramate dehydrogenase [Desulfovibrio sp.]|jgi:UDP-N-acetylmuramate dehydrogenase|nr:UDP-N-acetylmuramate dehydrogenase [Desulfovibrio sp.]